MMPFPRRLIEIDLPIRAISAHARREKSIRHGHISTLHIWWARRPLAACRAVLCAALWPDPADEHCPPAFRQAAALALSAFAEQVRADAQLAALCKDHWTRWVRTNPASLKGSDPACWPDLRYALLDFIADFANWDASTVPAFLETARLLTHVAHLSLTIADFRLLNADWRNPQVAISNLQSQISNLPRPLVVDPFAGGGSIPLEALRIGADAFASDLNPVAVLLNKVVLEYIPKYGKQRITITPGPSPETGEGSALVFEGLAEAVRYWGNWIKEQAEKELAEYYPKDPDGATPIAYLWARTVACEGPGCGAEVPLMRSLWLAKKGERSVGLRIVTGDRGAGEKGIDFEIIEKRGGKWYPQSSIGNPQSEIKNPQFDGTVRRGSATCPLCGYTTPVERVRVQLKARRGGAHDARLFCVVTTHAHEQGRFYRLPTERDLEAARKAAEELERRKAEHTGPLSLVPDEKISLNEIRRISVPLYGMETWGDLFTPRQLMGLSTLIRLVSENSLPEVVKMILALAIDRQADAASSLCRWHITGEKNTGTFGRQAIGMVWDFSEVNPFSDSTGSFTGALDWVVKVCDAGSSVNLEPGQIENASATQHPLSTDIAQGFVTDPPYYDAVPYSHLSDFFFVWLRRSLSGFYPDLLEKTAVPKEAEIVVDRPHTLSNSTHDIAYYERELTKAFAEGRRVLAPDGVGVIVFASKTTASWEAILQAVVEAGWVITGSWPIDTEMEARVAAQGQARLASSIHLVCRPRPDAEQSQSALGNPQSKIENIGDWRDVLAELPARIHAWLPRLAQEGVVGADAIFACLGPALEIFSRYRRVEKASGEAVTLKEYLEVVWAAVAREALGMIFEGADTSGFEEDSRLTAMWLWTLKTESREERAESSQMSLDTGESEDEETVLDSPLSAPAGFTLEYDAARKIAQGLGAHLEKLDSLVEVKGDKARLRAVSERAHALFGKQETDLLRAGRKKKATGQLNLFALPAAEGGAPTLEDLAALPPGHTALDRLHQAMLLFANGRSEALKRFLVDDGVGKDQRFWRLAQALSALYPSGSEEKRWVDGVLARKKGLGY